MEEKNRKSVNKYLVYLSAFVLTVAIALALLFLSAFLPQEPINQNVLTSAKQINSEENFRFGDYSYGSAHSLTSEALMLMTSKGLSKDHLDSVLSNTIYKYEPDNSTQEDLLAFAQGEEPLKTTFYSRYWMGFRVTLRLLLQKIDYFQIRRVTAYVFFALLFSVICSLCKNLDEKLALLFALSMIPINPHVVALSLQNFTCFCVAYIGMLLVPRIARNLRWEPLYFMELGMVTMYFDFYTNPLLTFGLPMIYLYLLRWKQGKENKLVQIAKNAAAWLCGYVGMWIAKLVLTSLFTPEDGISKGINSLLARLRLNQNPEYEEGYGPLDALYKVMQSVVADSDGFQFYKILVVLICLVFVIQFFRKGKPVHEMLRHVSLLVIMLIPIVWFSVASQPVVIHHYFQYRIIAVTIWAGLSYLHLCTASEKTGDGKTDRK